MAYLTGRNRAQLLVVSALALGVMFVALAVILNSAIFAESLATRGEISGANDAISYRGDLQRGVGAVLAAENRNRSTHAGINDSVALAVEATAAALTDRTARRGVASRTAVSDATDGSRINQSSQSRAYTDGTGIPDWTMATGVDRTRAFAFTVDRSELSGTCTLGGDCFALNVSNASADWTLSVTDGADGLTVEVDNGTTATCSSPDRSAVTVDVTAGTVSGVPCPAIAFGEAPTSGYDIAVENGDRIGGNYSLVVDDGSVTYPWTGQPSAAPALYDVTVDYEYRGPTVTVDAQLRVAPGETDA